MRLLYKSMVSILVIMLSLSLLLQVSCNCQSQETVQSPSATDLGNNSFIWKISSDSTQVYLLGSVHVASQDLYPLDKSIEDAFDSASFLVVEVNTGNISEIYASQLLMDYGMYSEGDGFKKNVSEDLYSKLEQQFQSYGTSLSLLDAFRPFVIYNLMSQFILEDFGYKIEYGIDLYFMAKAETSGKNILELETMEYQFALLSSIPDEIIIKGMQYDIDNPETEIYLQELFDAWVDGDAVKMETIVFEALIQEPELEPYYEIMYDQRNYDMAQKIEGFLTDDEIYFIVVGAGHLVGENGLINLLENKGYNVAQLEKND